MGSYLIKYSDEALQDLKNIFEYIASQLREPVIAVGQVNRIRESIRSLEQFPARNKVVTWEPWHSLEMRQIPVDNFIAFYTINNDTSAVNVVRVFYGKRDVQSYVRQSS